MALPGADRVLVPTTHAAPLSLAASGGYAITESQAGEGAHQRVNGTLAAAFGLAPNLAFSIGIDGRYDRHPGGDDGAVGTPQLGLVAGTQLTPALRLGAALELVVPGSVAPSLDFRAPALSLTALAAWQLPRRITIAAQLGFRLDETAEAAAPDDLRRLSKADRLALELSDFHALPMGLAAFQRWGRFELAAELSGEWLIGKGAPPALQSPLRAAGIARWRLWAGLTGEVSVRLGLSQRPYYARVEPLIPTEPRIGLGFGLRFVPELAAKAQRIEVRPARSEIEGDVIDPEGTHVSNALVAVQTLEGTPSTRSDAVGHYVLADLPRGLTRISVEGSGLVKTIQTIELDRSWLELTLRVARRQSRAQLRGLVRSFAGTPLAARVRVLSAGDSVVADKDGRFVLDLAPGEYEVQIECNGYLTQRRRVSVQDNGVTLLNVELRTPER
jgi:hypothetical protein